MSKMATGLARYFAKSLGGKLVFWFSLIKIGQDYFLFNNYCVTSYFEEVRSRIHCICLGGHLNAHHLIAKWAINIFASTLHCGVVWSIHRIDLQWLAWLSSVQGVHFNMAWPVFSGYSTSNLSGGSLVGTGLLLRCLEARSTLKHVYFINPLSSDSLGERLANKDLQIMN